MKSDTLKLKNTEIVKKMSETEKKLYEYEKEKVFTLSAQNQTGKGENAIRTQRPQKKLRKGKCKHVLAL